MTKFNSYSDVISLTDGQIDDLTYDETKEAYKVLSDFSSIIDEFSVEIMTFLDEGPINLITRDLTPVELKAIHYIGDNPGCRANDMVEKWGLSPAFVSRTLRRIEDLDLIYKEIDKDNRIYFNIYLTDEGTEYLRIIKACQSNLLSTMLDDLMEDYDQDKVGKFFEMCGVALESLVEKYFEPPRASE